MRLEVVLVPISDDERGSEFHLCLGFRLSADFGVMENHRVVRFPPPDPTSPANVGAGAPSGMTGSLDGLTLMVSDVADALERARAPWGAGQRNPRRRDRCRPRR